MQAHKPLACAAVGLLAALGTSGCGVGGGGGGSAAVATPTATTRFVSDVTQSSTSDTTVPIAINALSFSNTQDRSDTALPVVLD